METLESKESQKNTNTTDNLVSFEQIENSPLSIGSVWNDDKEKTEHYVLLGKNRLTNDLGSKEACEQWAKEITWNKIFTVIGITIKEFNKQNNKQ